MTLAAGLETGFAAAFGGTPDEVVRAPGRVNLIGEHTDYNDGYVLPCAIGVETRVAWRRTDARVFDIVALDFDGERDVVPIDEPIARVGGWRDYVRAMIAELSGRGVALPGMQIAISGTIARGSGLSSSASLEVALGYAMLGAAGQGRDPAAIAAMAQAAENDFVGMKCGIMDQMASAAGRAGSALLLDCRSLAIQAVPIPADTAIMIVQSGVVRVLVEGHYNARRRECEEAAAALGVASLRDVCSEMLHARRDAMPDLLFRRARHVVTENAKVLSAATALRAGDLTAMGRLMAQSHASMRDDFAITVPAVDRLVAIAQDAIGEVGGARMTGGGFGGAIVAVMPVAQIDRVAAHIRTHYRTPAGDEPDVQIERACAGVSTVTR